MYSTDDRKAALKTFVDDLEADTRLTANQRAFLTHYKGALDSGTKQTEDQRFLYIMDFFFTKIKY